MNAKPIHVRLIFLLTSVPLLLLSINSLQAQGSKLGDVVQWRFELQSQDSLRVQAHAEIAEGWYVYSQYLAEGGPVPTQLTLDLPEGAGLYGKTSEQGIRESSFDQLFEMEVVKYSKTLSLSQAFAPAPGQNLLSGQLRYMACDASRCLPPKTIPFELQLP